jgi:endonuclease/exonuclease/phosphatase family metal-dependent hydrolase
MIKSILFLAILVLMVMPGNSRGETTLNVMSFNIRFGTANDGPNHWDLRQDMVVDLIKRHDPDVIGLQECLDFQAEFLVQRLPDYRFVGIGRDRNGGGEMTAVMYKHRMLNPVEVENFWLSETPQEPASNWHDSAITRLVTRVKFWHRGDERFFSVFNTHFDHVGEKARQESARLILSRINELPAEHPVILVGDFNATAEKAEAWTILTEGGLSDAWLTAEDRSGPVSTWGAFRPIDASSDRRIDWVLYRGPIRAESMMSIGDNVEGRFPSDHLPVQARLVIAE